MPEEKIARLRKIRYILMTKGGSPSEAETQWLSRLNEVLGYDT